MSKWAERIILGYIFLKPFICEKVLKNLDFILNIVLFLSACLYILKEPLKKNHPSIAQPTTNLLDKIILVFFFSLLLSLAFSPNFLPSLGQLYHYFPLITLFYLVRLTNHVERKQLIFTLIISAGFVSLYSLHTLFITSRYVTENLLISKINYPFAQEFLARKRAFIPFMLPSLLSGYLVMIIMLCLGLTIQKIKENKKDFLLFLNIFCLILAGFTLFFTKSVGGWLVLTFSLSLFFLLGKMLNKTTLLVMLLIIIGLGAVFFLRLKTNKDFTKPSFSIEKRFSYWKETTNIIKQRPLTGTGPGNFSLRDSRYTHNSYLQIWAEMGILSFIGWLGIIFLFLKKGVENLSRKEGFYDRLGIFSAGVAFLIHNLIDFSFFIPQSSFLWWIILGLNFLP